MTNFKKTLSNETVALFDNTIAYYDEQDKLQRVTTFISTEMAKQEFNRITNSYPGRPQGSVNPHCNRNKPCLMKLSYYCFY